MSWFRRTRKERAMELDQMSAMLWGRLGPDAKISDRVKVTYMEDVGKYDLTPVGGGWSARFSSASQVEEFLRKSYEAAAAKVEYEAAQAQVKQQAKDRVVFSNHPKG